jgi:hypothetical protein
MAGRDSIRGLKKAINAAFNNVQIVVMVPVAAIAVVSAGLGDGVKVTESSAGTIVNSQGNHLELSSSARNSACDRASQGQPNECCSWDRQC